jgi:putative protease
MNEIEIGVVSHYFDKIGVVVINLTAGELVVGDTIHIKGHTTDVTSKVESLQIEHAKIDKGTVGQSVGTKITGKAREHDKVFKVVA